jgi:hypothetical protein
LQVAALPDARHFSPSGFTPFLQTEWSKIGAKNQENKNGAHRGVLHFYKTC